MPTAISAQIKNKAINPKDLENKAIVMLFWSSECGSCIDNFAALNKILEPSVTNKDLVVMAVTPDMNQEAMKILKKHPFPYADHINQGGGIISGYMPAGQYPAYIIADKNHKIRFSSKGTDPAILSGFKVALQEVISN
ncbi:MAG: redoxin domain-containing protein [Pedobacter sp.]|nr:MAG: redoxin domain-containing protein [Pedobacter sp.]